MLRAEPIVGDLYFPEGARWHDGRLWFAEIQAARASFIDGAGHREIVAQFDSPCSGLGFLPDGAMVVSLMQARALARVDRDAREHPGVVIHADLSRMPFDHINDIVTDGTGRTYVDALAYHMRWDEPRTLENGVTFHGFESDARGTPDAVTDSIVLVGADGSLRVVATGLLGPNGLAVTADGSTLIVAEWRVGRLTEFSIASDGSLGQPALFGQAPALPDGIAVDSEGAVWCASPQSGDCFRMLRGGEIVERAEPAAGNRVTACALGGPELRTLFLTTERQPGSGAGFVEAVEVDVPGCPR